MKKLLYILIAVIGAGATSCQVEDAMLFNDCARVQFTTADDYPFSFVWLDESVTSAVVKLPVRVIGGPQNVERALNAVQVEEFDVTYTYDSKGYVIDSTVTAKPNPAQSGQHYVPFNDSEAQKVMKVAADVVKDSLCVVLKRDASLATTKYRLRVRLQPTADFEVGESKYLERTIIVSDMLEQPTNWRSGYSAYNYLGAYSVPKHELMIRVLQSVQGSDARVDDEWITKGNSDPTIFVYWRGKFNEELERFNNDPANIASGAAPLREDPSNPNSTVISFPTRVN
ncbi:MAG: DUF4843 domain-containing protein [Bacteroidales bacterium]|nr:DUF4843 domain-containing protein [Bacteroidales bacterium]